VKRWPPWAVALVATLVVHAVIVSWLLWRDAGPPMAPVTVQLKDARSLTRVSVLHRSRQVAAVPVAAPAPVARPAVSVPVARDAPAGDAPAALPSPEVAVGAPGAPEGVPSAGAEAGDLPLSPTLSPGGGEGEGDGKVDFDALVHARLVSAAAQCYPAAARRFKQQGTVELSFCADASGALNQGAVKKSSGSELLDRAATECVLARASPFPSGAEGRCYSLPVRFGAP
jgi:protein TonB